MEQNEKTQAFDRNNTLLPFCDVMPYWQLIPTQEFMVAYDMYAIMNPFWNPSVMTEYSFVCPVEA